MSQKQMSNLMSLLILPPSLDTLLWDSERGKLEATAHNWLLNGFHSLPPDLLTAWLHTGMDYHPWMLHLILPVCHHAHILNCYLTTLAQDSFQYPWRILASGRIVDATLFYTQTMLF